MTSLTSFSLPADASIKKIGRKLNGSEFDKNYFVIFLVCRRSPDVKMAVSGNNQYPNNNNRTHFYVFPL